MQAYCSQILTTGPNGELLCVDDLGQAVEWTSPPIVDLATVAAPFSAGFLLIASFWALGHGISMFVDLVRR